MFQHAHIVLWQAPYAHYQTVVAYSDTVSDLCGFNHAALAYGDVVADSDGITIERSRQSDLLQSSFFGELFIEWDAHPL